MSTLSGEGYSQIVENHMATDTVQDLQKLPEILEHFDDARLKDPSKPKGRAHDTILLEKASDYRFSYVVEVQVKRRKLLFKTMGNGP